MRGPLRALFFLTAAITAAVVLYASLTAPPAAVDLGRPLPETYATGAYHVHTVRSDGSGTTDEVAEAAARAGLQFVIVTDHGDGTRTPDAPAYRHGVLVIDAVELNTEAGHLIALGLSAAAPYPLAGHPRDVVEDVHRLGGRAVIAHPDSPKPDLGWRGPSVDADGIEWINVDSEWRDERFRDLVAVGLRALIRSPESIASTFERPSRTLARWDASARQRPVFGLAAVDAHARIGWRETAEPRGRTALARPSYRSLFGTVVQTAILTGPLTGQPEPDAKAVLDALTTGRSFSTVSAFAGPATLDFSMEHESQRVSVGERAVAGSDVATFTAVVPQAPDARLVLLQDGKQIATGHGSLSHTRAASPGVYRVEVAFPGAPGPWLMSNPIVLVGPAGGGDGPQPQPDEQSAPAAVAVPATEWHAEHDPRSQVQVEAAGQDVVFSFAIADGPPQGQYAAIVADVTTASGIDTVRFVGRATAPMRVSLQLRLPGSGPDGSRWRRSIYLDSTPRPIAVRLQDFEPVGAATSRRPVSVPVQALLFVVDMLNTRPGTAGKIWVSDLRLIAR